MLKIKLNCRGFTILETVVALSIIIVGLLGVTSLLTSNLQAQSINRDILIASLLAQEGLELVRNVRDTNWLRGAVGEEWKYGTGEPNSDIVGGDADYMIDHDGTITDVNSFDNAQLYYDGLTFYTHNSGSGNLTPFPRLINVVDNFQGNSDIVAASSTVRWQERGRTHDYVAETVFYNWR